MSNIVVNTAEPKEFKVTLNDVIQNSIDNTSTSEIEIIIIPKRIHFEIIKSISNFSSLKNIKDFCLN